MIVARKRQKIRFVRARVFILALAISSFVVFFRYLSSGGFHYPVSDEDLLTDGIVLAALFVFLLLPLAWKPLGEDLAGYRSLTRELMKGWRGLLYSVASGAVPTVAMILVLVWYSAGRKVSDVLPELALPFTLALAAYGFASFWLVDRRVRRAARLP